MSDKAVVSNKPFFGAEEKLEVPWNQLSTSKPFKGSPPKLHELPTKHSLENMDQVRDELEKDDVFKATMALYADESIHEDLIPATDPTSLDLSERSEGCKKGALVLGMVNIYTAIKKLARKDDIYKISAIQLIKKGGKPVYQIAMPPNKAIPKANESIAFVPAAWVTTTTEKANMEVKYYIKDGYEFPYLVNTVMIKAKIEILSSKMKAPQAKAAPPALKREKTAAAEK